MGQKIKIDDKEYEVENLSDRARAAMVGVEFSNKRIKELENMKSLLNRAKKSYVES